MWLSTTFAIMHCVATHVFNKVLQQFDRDPICCLLSWFCVIAPSPSCQLNPPHVSDSMHARCVLIHQRGIDMSEGFQPNLFLFQTEQCELCCDLNVYVRSWCIRMFQIGVTRWTSQLDWFLLLLLYSEVFTFLMRTKLTVYGLEDKWHYLQVCLVVLGLYQ